MAMATHILAAIALKKDELVTSSYLASSLNTNPVVVRRILSELQKAGLVQTLAGKEGGSRLSKTPASISLFDIFLAIGEQKIFAFNPNEPNVHCPLSCVMKSVLEPVFQSMSEGLATGLRKIRLSEIVARAESLEAPQRASKVLVKKNKRRNT